MIKLLDELIFLIINFFHNNEKLIWKFTENNESLRQKILVHGTLFYQRIIVIFGNQKLKASEIRTTFKLTKIFDQCVINACYMVKNYERFEVL